jgi:predicted GNAT superfamily acetyltransferase
MPRAALELRPLSTHDERAACVRLQERIWGPGFHERVPPTILQLAGELGGIADGAFDANGTLLGFVFGITGVIDGRLVHWSDMLGVDPAARDRGIGLALKWHQRDVMLARGITEIRWTFDPLQAKNAWINLTLLGAVAHTYARAYYAPTGSPLHADGTDRLIVTWEIASERVARRAAGELPSDVPDVQPLNRVYMTKHGPACDAPGIPSGPRAAIAIPSIIDELRPADPALARVWRANVRTAFESCFAAGYDACDLVRGLDLATYVMVRDCRGADR